VRKDGKIILNGVKTFITNAEYTSHAEVIARDFTKEGKYSQVMTMFFVPLDAPGVKIEHQNKIGNRLFSLNQIYFDNVELEEKDIFGEEHKGFYQMMKNFETERLCIAANNLGVSILCFNEAAAYATQRIAFDNPISEYQLIQKKIADMGVKIENMRNMIYKVAWMIDNKMPIRAESPMCKLYSVVSTNEIADDALQIFAGIGYTEDCKISKIWRDVRTARIGGGTDEIMIRTAAKTLLKPFQK
jgi:alkylation response protein AidB-like acyl-CoA dehydrogenase